MLRGFYKSNQSISQKGNSSQSNSNRNTVACILIFFVIIGLSASIQVLGQDTLLAQPGEVASNQLPPSPDTHAGKVGTVFRMAILLAPVLIIFILAFFSLRHISREFYKSCDQRFNLELFAKSPLGLPEGTVGATLGLVGGALLMYAAIAVILHFSFFGNGFEINEANRDAVKSIIAAVGAVALLVLIIIGAVYYMMRLQKRFLDSCAAAKQLNHFYEAPAGLPQGTVRAVLALIIVAVSLAFITLQFFIKEDSRVPEGLMTLMSAVVAFYFANRASAEGSAAAVAHQTQTVRDERDQAVKAQDKTVAETKISKLKKGLQVVKAATSLLPEDKRKKYEELAAKLESGLNTAENLISGNNASGATDLLSGALLEFGRNNPAYSSIAKALPIFSKVLGTHVPAFALISAVITIGVKIGGARYERWKRRILHAPIKAASLPVDLIDGLMAAQEFKANPVLAQAFATELASGKNIELKDAAVDFINLDDAAIWEKYGARFESRLDQEQAVQSFRRLLSDNELRPYVEKEWLAQMGSYNNLMQSIDKLHEDEQATASLDEISLVYEGLHRQSEPVLKVVERVEEELKREKLL